MNTDPFSDILKLTNAESIVSGGFTAGGSWSIRFPAPDKIKFGAVMKGDCWLSIDGEKEKVHAQAGDVFLLSVGHSYILASDLRLRPLDAVALFNRKGARPPKIGRGEDFVQIGGYVQVDPISGDILTDVLPPWIHVRGTSPQAPVLRWLVDQLAYEQINALPGSSHVSAQLVQLMLVHILRAHIEGSGQLATSWLRAIADDRIAPALRLMHKDPGRAWQLEELAKSTAMSRTTFASRFKAAAGVPPLTYLLNWRMRLAQRALRDKDTTIYEIARSLGYRSESAFSHAFKRVVGSAPSQFRKA